MGKSNAKVYVQLSEGIKFSDVAGEDEATEEIFKSLNEKIENVDVSIIEIDKEAGEFLNLHCNAKKVLWLQDKLKLERIQEK